MPSSTSQGVGIHCAAQAVGSLDQYREAVAAIGQERVDRHAIRCSGIEHHTVEQLMLADQLYRKLRHWRTIGVCKAGGDLQDAIGSAGRTAGELLLEQGFDLRAGQAHRNQAVAKRLDGEHFAVGDFAGHLAGR